MSKLLLLLLFLEAVIKLKLHSMTDRITRTVQDYKMLCQEFINFRTT